MHHPDPRQTTRPARPLPSFCAQRSGVAESTPQGQRVGRTNFGDWIAVQIACAYHGRTTKTGVCRAMSRTLLALAITTVMTTTSVAAADAVDLSLYRSDNDQLFSAADRGSVSAGYALVHETRQVSLAKGQQVLSLDGLPSQIDTEALEVHFPGRDDVRTIASRLLLPDQAGLLSTHLGEHVVVYADSGQQLASGALQGTDNGLLVRGSDGVLTLVHRYAAVSLGKTDVRAGARLQQTLESGKAGPAEARLDYPTGGMGWRASYTGTLSEDHGRCRLELQSRASIANRSGRDWQATTLKLIAGEPNFGKSSAPRPQMMRATFASAAPAPENNPEQASMGDYRSYTVDGKVHLPDGSITQVPLYAAQSLDCHRSRVFEHGSSWFPSQPQLARDFDRGGNTAVTSRLAFKAFDNMPAGYLRVNGIFDGKRELLGEARMPDTPEGRPLDIALGTAFDLRGERERTAFSLDKAGHTLDESFRITLSNGGEQPRTVTVREHPNRWRQWTLVSSSAKPSAKSPETLEFELDVPAHGTAVLDYALRYHWTANDE